MNYGFVAPHIETNEEGTNHILGSANLQEPIINSLGDWSNYLPVGERQNRRGIETNACSLHGTETAIEEQLLFFTGVKANNSERYLANYAKNLGLLDPSVGADPHFIAEMRRNTSGTVPEERAPWIEIIQTPEEYYSLDINPLIPEAKTWYKEWRLNHKWLWVGNTSPQEKRKRIQDALKKGTVCVSVAAWYDKNGQYYKPSGASDNHWVNLFQASGDAPYKVLDSYPESEGDFIKELDPLYDFGFAKVYFLTPAFLFLRNLAFGTVDTEVQYLQRALQFLGYPIPHAVTSVYGTETRRAVWQFQNKSGIADDGSHFGPRTRLALNIALQRNLGTLDSLALAFRTYLGV